jgi:DNA-binding CsgD family transcriptional regulator
VSLASIRTPASITAYGRSDDRPIEGAGVSRQRVVRIGETIALATSVRADIRSSMVISFIELGHLLVTQWSPHWVAAFHYRRPMRERLTDAERAVIALVAERRSNAEIATLRGRSPRTVANQLATIFRKLQVSSRRELTAFGRTTLPDNNASIRAYRDWTSLTLREREVLACANLGHSNKLIAFELGLATSTVAVHLSRARTKLGSGH